SEDKNEAPEIANTIADVYRESRLRDRKQYRLEGVAALQEQYKQKEEEARIAKESLNEMRRTNDIPDLDGSIYALNTAILPTDTLRTLEDLRIRASAEYLEEATLLESLTNLSREDLRNSLPTIIPSDLQLSTL